MMVRPAGLPRSVRDLSFALIAGLLVVSGDTLAGPPCVTGGGVCDPPARVTRQVFLMGTRATLTTRAADRARGLEALDRMLAGLETTETELSTWRDDSLLSAINRGPVGQPQAASPAICELLDELAGWHRLTGGAFDPAIGILVDAWGLGDGGRHPSTVELDLARRQTGLAHLRVRAEPCEVTRARDVRLDAGAFGKGAAIDRVAGVETARGAAPWMIDLGGQVAVGGGGESWPVALAHPSRRDRSAIFLRVTEGSLATSGGSVRDMVVDGRTIGHILDPRTGLPVVREASVTVWHASAMAADILSTALYVMGIDEGLVWADTRGLAACFLAPGRDDGEVTIRATTAFRARFLQGAPRRG